MHSRCICGGRVIHAITLLCELIISRDRVFSCEFAFHDAAFSKAAVSLMRSSFTSSCTLVSRAYHRGCGKVVAAAAAAGWSSGLWL